MKIFVKPNPFWEMILGIVGVIIMWTLGSLVTYYVDVVIGHQIRSVGEYFGLGLLTSLWLIAVFGIIFCVIRHIYIVYRQSYPKKPKKQKSNTKDQIRTIQDESNYEVNKYKNNLKSIL